MKSLKKIQQDFHQAIFQKNSNLDFIASSFPVERLAIYKNTIFENIEFSANVMQIEVYEEKYPSQRPNECLTRIFFLLDNICWLLN